MGRAICRGQAREALPRTSPRHPRSSRSHREAVATRGCQTTGGDAGDDGRIGSGRPTRDAPRTGSAGSGGTVNRGLGNIGSVGSPGTSGRKPQQHACRLGVGVRSWWSGCSAPDMGSPHVRWRRTPSPSHFFPLAPGPTCRPRSRGVPPRPVDGGCPAGCRGRPQEPAPRSGNQLPGHRAAGWRPQPNARRGLSRLRTCI